ncbi:MAG: glutamyl-tRNA reductase [Actinomycetota bacterium]
MTVLAIGLNHRSAPAELLDQVNLSADRLPKALAEVATSEMVTEAVVLSTCNRTEVYVHAERFHDGFRDVRDALAVLSGVAPETFDPYLYAHYHHDAVRHLFEVTAGLDSVVLGEHEILGQVGRAWEAARTEGTSGAVLNLLFQRAVEAGKRVRSETEIGRSTASLSHAAVTMLTEERGQLDGLRVMLVGLGEVGSDVATALARKHDITLTVANRTAVRAAQVAAGLGATAVTFADWTDQLAEVDVLITATGADGAICSNDTLSAAVEAPGRNLFVLDLALPRDVPSDAGTIDGITLCDLSAVQAHANRGMEARRRHVEPARAVVGEELERYRSAASAREVAPLIGGMHGWAEGIRSSEMDRYAARLAQMADSDRATVEALSRSIVAKMLHPPTVTLKDAAGTPRGDRLAEAARELFDQ